MLRYGPFRLVRTMLFFDGDELRDFRFGSGTDIPITNTDVRFTPESGHWSSVSGCGTTSPPNCEASIGTAVCTGSIT